MKTRRVPSESGPIEHCLVENRATLVWLADLADLELHTPMALARGQV